MSGAQLNKRKKQLEGTSPSSSAGRHTLSLHILEAAAPILHSSVSQQKQDRDLKLLAGGSQARSFKGLHQQSREAGSVCSFLVVAEG